MVSFYETLQHVVIRIEKKYFQTCDFDLYWFSFAVILLGWVAVCLAVAYIINKYGRELLNCVTCNKYGY